MTNKICLHLGAIVTLVALAQLAAAQQRDQSYQSLVLNGEGLNVRTFGATGSGITDDTTPIQNAINAAGVGDAIIFPNGTYLVTGLTITKRVTLMGWGSAILKANNPTQGTTLLAIGPSASTAEAIEKGRSCAFAVGNADR